MPDSNEPSRADPLVGSTVGSYRIVAVLGVGGMGIVYLAEHTRLGHEAGLKVLHASVARDPEMVQRFAAEARAVASIGHQNIVKVFDFGELADGRAYFVMERLKGLSLLDELAVSGALQAPLALGIARQVAAAIAAAHDAGIIHRDLKPDNIYLLDEIGSAAPVVKVLDFGIAKLWRDPAPGHTTQAGAIFGTPEYISPEQGQGLPVDGRSDLYSLGVVLWQMLTGQLPFTGPPGKVVAHHILDEITDVRSLRPDVPAPAADLVATLLMKDPAARIQTAELLVDAIDAILQPGAAVAAGAATRGSTTLSGLAGIASDRGSGLMGANTRRAPEPPRPHPTLAHGELVTPVPRRAWRPALAAATVLVLVAAGVTAFIWSSAGDHGTVAARTTAPATAASGVVTAGSSSVGTSVDDTLETATPGRDLSASSAAASSTTSATGSARPPALHPPASALAKAPARTAGPKTKKPRSKPAAKDRAKPGTKKEAGDAVLRPTF